MNFRYFNTNRQENYRDKKKENLRNANCVTTLRVTKKRKVIPESSNSCCYCYIKKFSFATSIRTVSPRKTSVFFIPQKTKKTRHCIRGNNIGTYPLTSNLTISWTIPTNTTAKDISSKESRKVANQTTRLTTLRRNQR